MIEVPKWQQATMFKLGVALHAKYPEEALKLVDKPLQEIADFVDEHENLKLAKGNSMEVVDELANILLRNADDAT
jgi:hypothetical protein